jgi:hypothetical protein
MDYQIKPINLPNREYILSVLRELLSDQDGVEYSISIEEKNNG